MSWGAVLEPQTSFWDVFFFLRGMGDVLFLNSHSESYFYKFDWTTTK